MINVGVDLGIRKIAYSVWEDEKLVTTQAHESAMPTRHEELEEVADFLYCDLNYTKPDNVWIEDTLIGNNARYSIKLSQTMGAVLVRMAELSHMRELGIYTVNQSKWKKEVLGCGNASKTAIQEYVRNGMDSAYAVLCGNDQDRFDAACIGYYGVKVAQRAISGQLA